MAFSFRRWRAAGGVMALVCALALFARAEEPTPTPAAQDAAADAEGTPEAAEAREAFVRGSALARGGRWKEALGEFEASEELRPHPVTAYNIGYVERALGHYTRARSALRRALAARDPALPDDLAAEAAEYAEEVEKKVARVRVVIDGDSIAVSVDGRPLEVERSTDERRVLVAGIRAPGPPEVPPFPVFDLLVDPGEHVLSVRSADGSTEAVQETAKAGAPNVWTLRGKPAANSAGKKQSASTPPAADKPERAPAQRASKRPYAYVAYGVGAAGLIVGTTFGLMALSNQSDLDDVCRGDGGCPPSAQDTIDAYEFNTTLADYGFVFAIGGAALGTYFLLTEPPSEPGRKEAGVRLRGSVGLGGASLSGEF